VRSKAAEQKFKAVVRALWAGGTYPGPTAINRAFGRTNVNQRNLNGDETRWRREVMRDLGIPYARGENKGRVP